MDKALNRTLQAWAKETREALDERVVDLFTMAAWDLDFGPYHHTDYSEECPTRKTEWPGFEAACAEVSATLRDVVPSKLYVDVDCEGWSTDAPEEWETCLTCDGAGEHEGCTDCDNAGRVPAYLECWYEVDRNELLRALVGKDLAEYVR